MLSYNEIQNFLSHLGLNWYRVMTDKHTNIITVANTCYSYASCCT